jgi:hypothetical protein
VAQFRVCRIVLIAQSGNLPEEITSPKWHGLLPRLSESGKRYTVKYFIHIISCEFNIFNLGTWVSSWNCAACLMHTRICILTLYFCVETLFIRDGLKISETPGIGIVKIHEEKVKYFPASFLSKYVVWHC